LSSSTRFFAIWSIGSLSPKRMELVGQVFAQAVGRSFGTRSEQNVHLLTRPVSLLNETTPNGQDATQSRQPLQTSWLMSTVPQAVRWMAPVGQASRHPACWQCLQTSDIMSHWISPFFVGRGSSTSMNFTKRQERSLKLDRLP
jgi:hypothetical protein